MKPGPNSTLVSRIILREKFNFPKFQYFFLSSANDFNDHPIDMDMDSPFSPNDSDISDIFEPPSIFDKLTPGNKKGRKANGNVSSSTRMHSKIGKRGRKGKLR